MILSKGKAAKLLGAVLFFTVSCANAQIIQPAPDRLDYLKHFEVSAAGGVDWYSASNTKLVVSPLETDNNHTNHSSTNGAWKIGIGYYPFENNFREYQYLNQLLFEINVYQTSTNLSGSVWQYELPQFNNYNFKAPVKSTRLMFDVKPSFFSWKNISPYAIMGVGLTWNTVSYTETARGAGIDPASVFTLSGNTTNHVAWDLGAGCRIALTDNLSATAEYLYAFLGHGFPANKNSVTTVPNFALRSQSLLFGLTLKFL